MCVLWACRDSKPPEHVIRAGFSRNKDGAGVAWIEGNKVHWSKGIKDVDDLVAIVETLPLPCIIHCRLISCGGSSLTLTHPFPLVPGVSLSLTGTASKVLAHNGHWSGYDDWLKRALFNAGSRIKLPEGPWSDTRAIAWLTSNFGMGILDLLPSSAGKLAVLDAKAKAFTYISGKWHLDDFDEKGYLQSSDVGSTKESKLLDWPEFYESLGTGKTVSMSPCTSDVGLPDADFSVEFHRKIGNKYRKFRRYVKYDKNQVRIERTTELVAKGVEIPLDAETSQALDKALGKNDKLATFEETPTNDIITQEFTQEEINKVLESDDETVWASAFGS